MRFNPKPGGQRLFPATDGARKGLNPDGGRGFQTNTNRRRMSGRLPMQAHHVSAGSYFVGPKQPLLLEAFLGTCVAVAMVDAEAGVGGLAHYLLPEPVSLQSAFQLDKYAASGMPIFLKALFAAGAHRDRLRATIAGGALIGPLDDLDLNLDIGGRTAETVEKILLSEGIPIETAETGGVFSCCLKPDMQQWTCRIDPSSAERLASPPAPSLPAPGEIERVAEGLQPVPQAALKIMRLIEQEEYDLRLLAAELRKDQVLSARTLQLANSVMFSTRQRIESIDHALMHLGVNLVMKFVIAAAVEGFFAQSGTGYSLCRGGLYHHAVGVAVIAEKLARLTGAAKPGIAYAAGLLHDIGKVVLDQFVGGAYPLFYRRLIEERTTDFTQAEQALFGTTHPAVGFQLAQRWSFPDSLAEGSLVFLSNLLMSRFLAGLVIGRQVTHTIAPRLAAIGLSPSQLPQIVDLIPMDVFEASPAAAIGRG
jgi:putative nucleotidyltransferase with HDIG domain